MEYALTFLEGMISFISPCILPMLPIYVSYFAGKSEVNSKAVVKILFFILGFTVVFTSLGMFAGFLGSLLVKYSTVLNVVTGAVVIVFGLSYLELLRIPFFKGMISGRNITSAFSAFIFGVVFSVSLTPCTGAFLGSAIMLASGANGGAVKGAVLLLCYSLGLGIPFAVSGILLDKLSEAFSFIKKHYNVINKTCGLFLVVLGICMCFGIMSRFALLFA